MEYEKIYTSDMSDSQWEIVREILKEENYRCVTEGESMQEEICCYSGLSSCEECEYYLFPWCPGSDIFDTDEEQEARYSTYEEILYGEGCTLEALLAEGIDPC